MLDENLPTFFNRPSSDHPHISVLTFAQNGSEPTAEYVLRRADPALPASRNKFAVGLTDSGSQDVIYAEVLIEPEWTQPTLSAAEIRASNGVSPPPAPVIPGAFTVQLYNPDYQVSISRIPSSWNNKESWEFEMPQQSFRVPSTSQIDRQQQSSDPAAAETTPKALFKWKRDGRLSKDMTCYMIGRSVNGRKNKEPDITVALFKQGKSGEFNLTIYEPNMQRVEVEDRKGLEIVLLLGAEVIMQLYLAPKMNPFNVDVTYPGVTPVNASSRRKNSRPSGSSAAAAAMSGALSNPPQGASSSSVAPAITSANNLSSSPPSNDPRTQWEIEQETRRLKAMFEKEKKEQEKREKADQKQIRKILEEEERERQRREAEVAKETERLKKMYGVGGQDYGFHTQPLPQAPQLPPRPMNVGRPSAPTSGGFGGQPGLSGAAPPPPLRPVSAGPMAQQNQGTQGNGSCSWWGALSTGRGPGHILNGSGPQLLSLGGGGENKKNKVQKKQSVHF